ncbi:integrin-linked kinase-associated serine/threonine phosphatase 2C isoform X3 [Megalobrama amblycephala]|uniref:integrin-linked kinase-associated serine/threonine phosphatase 2C isoform X3 n=1 Tax=Megalobrama amblycephala TaxID=75352 RepID=UPI00201475E5|nr:integrin-linked kinase-associated serine/threonine phosphatase 2C isoform X3 [Megalobrama amblycephala]
MFGLSFCCLYTVLTSRGRQRGVIHFETVNHFGSIDSKLRKLQKLTRFSPQTPFTSGSEMDLFGDLPEPTNDPVKAKQQDEERGEKRKRDVSSEETEVEDQNQEEKKVCKDLPKLMGFVSARRGEREEMQDAHVLLPELTMTNLPSQVSRLAYFAVFDGHGGARASQFAADNLHHTLVSKFPKGDVENLEKLVRKCLLDTFRQTDEDFLKKASSQKPAWKDGSTATCMLAVDDVLYVANLGDSRNEKVEQKEGQSEEAGRFEAACQRLATEAVRRGSADNVTVILVSIAF